MGAVVSYLTTPDPTLDYSFLTTAFLVLSLVSAAFFAAQYSFGVASVAGYWMVCAPCLPAAGYAFLLHRVVRARAAAAATSAAESKKSK
jgi:hypothetical protein